MEPFGFELLSISPFSLQYFIIAATWFTFGLLLYCTILVITASIDPNLPIKLRSIIPSLKKD